MAREAERIYPSCPTVIRVVRIDGLTKGELLARLLVKTVGFLRRLDAPLVLALLPLGTLFWEYLSLGAGFSREQEMEDTRREVEK